MDDRPSVLSPTLLSVFGEDAEPIEAVEERLRAYLPHTPAIVWEGDASTFAFTYVGGDAEDMLGFSRTQWTEDPVFWANHIIHPEDRSDAVAFCALATGRKADHVFEYRAITQAQDIVWLRDFVRVIVGPRGIPVRLRGLMFDVSEEKWAERAARREAESEVAPLRLPAVADLEAAG
ncbi:MAG: PAS domain-containing protein [Rhodothermales bacterium]|nr:PAS domain-containing protein [Rhodothermales bacterium]